MYIPRSFGVRRSSVRSTEKMEMWEGGCRPLTTFVHADRSTFREVVQRLTGGGSGPNQTQSRNVKISRKATMSPSINKLHERRKCIRRKIEILQPTITNVHFELPSPLVSPSTIFSKVSIVAQENRRSPAAAVESTVRLCDEEDEINSSNLEEKKAIEEWRFYFYRSPRGKSPPELLTLFPFDIPQN